MRFEDLVAAQWRPLLSTAHLVTGADAPAAELVTRGLAAARRAVRALPDDADEAAQRRVALAGLCRARLGSRWLPAGGEVTVTGTGTGAGAWWVAEADVESARRLSAALDRLDTRQRLAVVLAHHEGLPVAEVGALLDEPDPAGLLAGAERELAAEVPDPATLGARLDVMAAQSSPQALTDDSAAAAARAHGRTWRRRAGLVVAAAAALVAAVGITPDRAPDRPRPPVTAAGPAPVGSSWPSLGDEYGRTRGSLAGDAGYLAAVLATAHADLAPRPTTERRVAFAGDVGGTRLVLVVQRGRGQLTGSWLAGPAGAAVADLELRTSGDLIADQPTGVVDDSTGNPTLLVLTRPGDRVAVSTGIDVAPDGTVSRSYRPASVTDGVAVVPLDRTTGQGARFTVTRDGRTTGPGYVMPLGGLAGAGFESAPRSGVLVGPGTLVSPLYQVTGSTGWAGADLDVTVLGSGPFPAGDGLRGEAVVLAVTLPGGAVVTVAGWSTEGRGTYAGGSCGTTVHPAGTDLPTLAVAHRCELYGSGGWPPSLLLVAAPPGVAATTTTASGAAAPLPLENGWATRLDDADPVAEVAVDGARLVQSDPATDPLAD